MSDAAEFKCLLPFDTDSTEFARGFEVGRLWSLVQADAARPVEGVLIHAGNAEMAMRIGEVTGRPFSALDLGGAWLSVSYGPSDSDGVAGDDHGASDCDGTPGDDYGASDGDGAPGDGDWPGL